MIYFYEHTDSTNRIAKEMVENGAPAGTVVVAASQSAGRGQYGRSFDSPSGGLYFSAVVEPALPPERIALVTLATGLACRNVLHESFQIDPRIKWPNDLFLDEKKLAGILCEHLDRSLFGNQNGKVVIGVGLNVNSRIEQFAPEVRPLVTTLFEQLQRLIDLPQLLDHLLLAIMTCVNRLSGEQETLLEEWQRYDMLMDKPIIYATEAIKISGYGQGIGSDGTYRIRDDEGQVHTVLGGQLRLDRQRLQSL